MRKQLIKNAKDKIVGNVVYLDRSTIIELHMFPDRKFFVYENEGLQQIKAPKEYTKNGEKKTFWAGVGAIKDRVMTLDLFPSEVFSIHEDEWRGRGQAAEALADDLDSIPF